MGRYDDGMTVIPIAAALIEDGAGHVLLVRKADTRFFMQAGGKIEPGEEPAAALVRELHEEIGLIVAEADLQPLDDSPRPPRTKRVPASMRMSFTFAPTTSSRPPPKSPRRCGSIRRRPMRSRLLP